MEMTISCQTIISTVHNNDSYLENWGSTLNKRLNNLAAQTLSLKHAV